MDRLTGIEVFVAAVDEGSFAAAARTIGLSPQMVAKHMRSLETRLGGRLLHRTTRRQHLTALGEAYLDRCRLILSTFDEAEALATTLNSTIRGRLRVTAPVPFGGRALVPFVRTFLRDHPEIEIDLVLSDRLIDLVGEGCDVAFRIGPLADSGLASRPLAPQRLLACASPAYLAEHGTPMVPADLARHECIGRPYWQAEADRMWRFTRGAARVEVEVRSRLHVSDAEALLAAGLDGAGIVLGAEAVLSPSLDLGTLVRVLPGYRPPWRAMHLVFVRDRHAPLRVRRFIDEAARAFGRPRDDGP